METDSLLKVLVAISAAEASNRYLTNKFANRTEEQAEIDSRNRNIILTIRAIILVCFSIKYKWPIDMCYAITIIITILVIVLRTITDEETNTDNEKNTNNKTCEDNKKKDKV